MVFGRLVGKFQEMNLCSFNGDDARISGVTMLMELCSFYSQGVPGLPFLSQSSIA